MAFFEWDDSYSVGVAVIDEQHKRLIALINDLYEAMKQGDSQNTWSSAAEELDAMASVLDELVDYTSYHFSTEERYMREHAYPEYAGHKQAHGRFVERTQALKRDFDEGKAIRSMEIIEFLRDWWKEHILGVDKNYGPFFNEKGLT